MRRIEWRRWFPRIWPRYHFDDERGEDTSMLGIWMHLDWLGFTVARWRPRKLNDLCGVEHWLLYDHGLNGIKFQVDLEKIAS